MAVVMEIGATEERAHSSEVSRLLRTAQALSTSLSSRLSRGADPAGGAGLPDRGEDQRRRGLGEPARVAGQSA